MRHSTWIVLTMAIAVAATARADERLKGIACRSVHLGYPGPQSSAFYNEVTVRNSSDGTYFMVCGWSAGYFGLQELADGKKVLLFSVWDPASGDDPSKVPPEKRVKLLHRDPAVRVGRFGNEGTGGQSFLDYNWKVGQTYRFLVTARPDGTDRTAYSGFFYRPEKKAWTHLVTFSTLTNPGQKMLQGQYSFVEDFRRNRISATRERRAEFGNGWRKANGAWSPIEQARFTADGNPVTNIDAGTVGPRFFLATGGEVANRHTKLNETIEAKRTEARTPPDDLPEIE